MHRGPGQQLYWVGALLLMEANGSNVIVVIPYVSETPSFLDGWWGHKVRPHQDQGFAGFYKFDLGKGYDDLSIEAHQYRPRYAPYVILWLVTRSAPRAIMHLLVGELHQQAQLACTD